MDQIEKLRVNDGAYDVSESLEIAIGACPFLSSTSARRWRKGSFLR